MLTGSRAAGCAAAGSPTWRTSADSWQASFSSYFLAAAASSNRSVKSSLATTTLTFDRGAIHKTCRRAALAMALFLALPLAPSPPAAGKAARMDIGKDIEKGLGKMVAEEI